VIGKLAAIAAGGALGAVGRYAITMGAHRLWKGAFPSGTFIANVLGCFLIGLLATLLATKLSVREEIRLFLLVGFLGGLTTFSTYGFETLSLLLNERLELALGYVLVSNGAGILAVLAGYRVAARMG